MNTAEKLTTLRATLRSMERVLVAFSGGVDSTFLLKIAYETLGGGVLAATAKSPTLPERELDEAIRVVSAYGIAHRVMVTNELELEAYSDNPPNRCYICKRELFSKLRDLSVQEGIVHIIEGSNLDDLGDYRPGLKALAELGIRSPLREAGLTKTEIRLLSKEMGLPTWDKPSLACLSSRFPYGEKITVEKLQMVEQAEKYLQELGFKQLRVRHHGAVARLEVEETDFDRLTDQARRMAIYDKLTSLGFVYVAMDLKGYRTGSMNEGGQVGSEADQTKEVTQ